MTRWSELTGRPDYEGYPNNYTPSTQCSPRASRDILQIQPMMDEFEQRWPEELKVFWYFACLMWAFMGVSIIADIFMSAIDEITMATRITKDRKTGKKKLSKVWNPTVANLSLMALGSSAPEIMLNVLDILLGDFYLGDLGPSTIVGSAAFNLFVILAICVMSVKGGEVKKIKQMKVYTTTAIFSVLAYIWLLVILVFNSKDVVTPVEGILTFALFFVVLGLAYAGDQHYWGYLDKFQVSPEDVSSTAHSVVHTMDENTVMQLMKAKTSANDPAQYNEDEMADHVEKLMKAIQPPNRATYRNDSIVFLTGKKQRPKLEDLPPSLVAEVTAAGGGVEKSAMLISGPAELAFEETAVEVMENHGHVTLVVRRTGGTDGTCSCEYASTDISATQGKDYVAAKGTLTFEVGQLTASIQIKIIDDDKAEGKEKFRVQLTGPTGASLKDNGDLAVVTILSDEQVKGKMGAVLSRLGNRDKMEKVMSDWKGQFVDAITIPAEDEGKPTCGERTLHIMVVFWKVTFALVPPVQLGGGWVAFFVALTFIAFTTMFIGDTAEFMGCAMGLNVNVTAITFVAVGTSLPDTFASKRAAEMEENADASVGNVTGSNCVNVFLGLGLPWMMAAIYWDLQGPDAEYISRYSKYESVNSYIQKGQAVFVVKDQSLAFSVIVFCVCATTCLSILSLRRTWFGGELGGPEPAAKATAGVFVSLWLTYVILSIIYVYVIMDDEESGSGT